MSAPNVTPLNDFSPEKTGTINPDGLFNVLQELQGLRVKPIFGVGGGTEVALPGIKAGDHLVGAIYFKFFSGPLELVDVGPSVAGGYYVEQDGYVISDDFDTTDGYVVFFWFDKRGAS